MLFLLTPSIVLSRLIPSHSREGGGSVIFYLMYVCWLKINIEKYCLYCGCTAQEGRWEIFLWNVPISMIKSNCYEMKESHFSIEFLSCARCSACEIKMVAYADAYITYTTSSVKCHNQYFCSKINNLFHNVLLKIYEKGLQYPKISLNVFFVVPRIS